METFSLDFSGDRANQIWLLPEEQEASPVRSFVVLKDKAKLKECEEREDCFILDFDPYDSGNDISKLTVNKDHHAAADYPDLCIVAQTGQVACMDYPHSRHDCRKHPFERTPHESYCELCYCYVCDVAAPCFNWSGQIGHCHAVHEEKWTLRRNEMREILNLIRQQRKANALFSTNVY